MIDKAEGTRYNMIEILCGTEKTHDKIAKKESTIKKFWRFMIMNKKLRFLMALAMCCSMSASMVACDVLTSFINPEEESTSSLPVGPETDNEVGPKATVATADISESKIIRA